MNLPRMALCILLALSSTPLLAATVPATSKQPSAQQQRMAQCSSQNKGMKGADYKAAQKACLSGQPASVAHASTPQQRMAQCSAQNKGKKGADYKAAQSACLKTH